MNMAVGQRHPTAVIHHSDQGCQYTSVTFGLRCREAIRLRHGIQELPGLFGVLDG